MATKAEKAKLNTVIRTRVTDEIANMLQAKAIRENIDMATVIREIIYQYFEDSVNDTKIFRSRLKKYKTGRDRKVPSFFVQKRHNAKAVQLHLM